ncbi:MAG TPA: hypothetical protein PLT36_01510 [Erysipelotrichaceae bacterium]|jgi:hypothetical protein|nr:hypothetical protein [Erysipelotrichaceae bacterium]HQA84499.1 hypothetical protein [Erysipelotrichaceae bacterium]
MRRGFTNEEIRKIENVLKWQDTNGKGDEFVFLPNTPESVKRDLEYLKNIKDLGNTAE